MEGTDEEVEEEIKAEKKELGDLIQDVLKALRDIGDELNTHTTNTTNLTKNIEEVNTNIATISRLIAEIKDGNANISENQQLLFNQHKDLLGEPIEEAEKE